MELEARQTSKQTNIHTKKNWTLKLRCLQPPVEMKRRVEWSNIISHEHTSHIFCNHFPCLCHWHNTPSVKCHTQCQHPCYITEQHTTVDRTFHDFDHDGSESHIWSHNSEWIQKSVIHCNIGSVNPPFHLCRRFRGISVFKYYVCLYVCWSVCLIN